MSGTTVYLRGVEQVLQHYDKRATPFYAVYYTKDLLFNHVEDDMEAGRVWLCDNLTMMHANGTTAIHKIEFYECLTDKKKLVKENLLGVIPFRLNDPSAMVYNGNSQQPIQYKSREVELMEKILENQNLFDSRLKAIEIAEDEEEEETPGAMGMKMLSGVLDQPEMQRAFAQRLLGLLDSIMPLKTNGMQNAPASVGNMSITPDDVVIIETAIQTLLNNGMVTGDMKLLADMSNEDPAQFKFLLSLLRKQK